MSERGFEPVKKGHSGPYATKEAISVSNGMMNILTVAYEEMGEPDAVRFFYKDDRVAIVPADPDHSDSYTVTTPDTQSRASVSVKWLHRKLSHGEVPQGRFPVEQDGDLWVVDFSDPEGEQV